MKSSNKKSGGEFNLRVEYGKRLDNLEEAQKILIEYFIKKKGDIIGDQKFNAIEERVQRLLLNTEEVGGDVEKYREIQNELEKMVDKLNKPEIPENIREVVVERCILLKNRYYTPRKYKCHADESSFEE